MSKRWTFDEDLLIVTFYQIVGPSIGPRDLGRSEAAVTARAAALRSRGGWDALRDHILAEMRYSHAMRPRGADDLMDTQISVLRTVMS